MTHWIRTGLTCLVLMMAVACGGHSNNGTDANHGGGDGGDVNGDGGTIGDGGGLIDGGLVDAPPFSGMCTPGGAQCANCIDDDKDGLTDGEDPQCTGATDNDEATFATGIPGDNKDAIKQDCFFDGNSGSGNDGCDIHVCCLLGAKTLAECPSDLRQGYDPKECPPPIGTATLSDKCIQTCGKAAPPGCDCFGCCTICDPATNHCVDILINPATSGGCTLDKLDDPAICKTCTQVESCGNPDCSVDPETPCVLCPGQDPNDLPASCGGNNMCPSGSTSCIDDSACDAQSYCSNGCCIGVIL